jgi:hypothetical protein
VHLTTTEEAANQTKPNTAKESYMNYNRMKSSYTMIKLSQKRYILKTQNILMIRRKLTGTFARNTSLRIVNAFPCYIKVQITDQEIVEEKIKIYQK